MGWHAPGMRTSGTGRLQILGAMFNHDVVGVPSTRPLGMLQTW